MTLTVEVPDDVANSLKQLSDKDLAFYHEGVQMYATHEAERLAKMTDAERQEYEEVCDAIAESMAQIERGETMSWEEAKARSDRELAVLIAQEKAAQ